MPIETHILPAQRITEPPGHHFFGYYDKSPWDLTGRYVLAMRVGFMDRPNTADDAAELGLIDLHADQAWQPFDRTTAWCWQQGAMLQWLPGAADRQVIYNQRDGERFAAVVRDVHDGTTRTLDRPIYCLSPDGRWALSLNFKRLAVTRPGYGYPGLDDPGADDPHPADDGIWLIDLADGSHRLILTLEQLARHRPRPDMPGARHWVNHLCFSPDGQRFAFLHRWAQPGATRRSDQFCTADRDGRNLHVLNDDMTSHYDWRDADHILAWARREPVGLRYWLMTDRTNEAKPIGEAVFDCDGHCSFSPDRRWLLTDTYPIEAHRTLMLYEIARDRRIDIGRYHSPPQLTREIRCDLHPRWSRDGRHICFDSAHEGTRQMYTVDASSLTA